MYGHGVDIVKKKKVYDHKSDTWTAIKVVHFGCILIFFYTIFGKSEISNKKKIFKWYDFDVYICQYMCQKMCKMTSIDIIAITSEVLSPLDYQDFPFF